MREWKENSIVTEGRSMCRNGAYVHHNPYRLNTTNYSLWFQGWYEIWKVKILLHQP